MALHESLLECCGGLYPMRPISCRRGVGSADDVLVRAVDPALLILSGCPFQIEVRAGAPRQFALTPDRLGESREFGEAEPGPLDPGR